MKELLIAGLLTASCTCASATARQALMLHLGDNTEVVYFLDDQPIVSLDRESMTVTTRTGSRTLPMGNVKKWTVGMVESNVTEIEALQPTILVNGGTVSIVGPQRLHAAIFNLEGTMLSAADGTEIEFNPGPGIFIVKINSNTYKIAVR